MNTFKANTSSSDNNTILKIDNLSVQFKVKVKKKFFSTYKTLYAVNNVSFTLKEQETLGIVGESGCGKSTLSKAILKLLPPEALTKGRVLWCQEDINLLNKKKLKTMRKHIEVVFQDPLASLNPRMNIFEIISEPLIVHYPELTKEEIFKRVCKVVEMVGLNPKEIYRYPHEFSGGQSQRIGIARAIILRPKLIVCDEAVSALDVSIKAQIINLLQQLKATLNIAFLFISHDLSIVEYISDRVMVLYLGEIMELANVEDLYKNPLHPYTRVLVEAVPIANPEVERKKPRNNILGDIPSPFDLPKGCPFASRCKYVFDKCLKEKPELRKVKNSLVACFLAEKI